MDRRMKQVHTRQQSGGTGTPVTPSSPMMSPIHPHHIRTGSSGVKKAHTKAAAQRLAQVMSNQLGDDDDDEDDDLSYDPSGISGLGLAGGGRRPASSARTPVVKAPAAQSRAPLAKTRQRVEEDDDVDDFSYDHGSSGAAGIGLAGGRRGRPKSPLVKTPAQSHAQVKMSQPPMNEDNDVDDLSNDYNTGGIPTLGLGGRRPRPQSPMAKPSAQSHAQVKTNQPVDDDDNDLDGRSKDHSSSSSKVAIGHAGGKSMRSRSPMVVRTQQEGRSSLSSSSAEQPPLAHASSAPPPSQPSDFVDQQPLSSRATIAGRSSISSLEQPQSAHSSMTGRPSANSMEQPPSARAASAGRPGIKAVPMPSSVPITLRPVSAAILSESPINIRKDKRLSLDMGSMNFGETGTKNSTSALQDELDMLQEENESLLDKLRLAEDRSEEAEARAQQLEKQIANLGEGLTLESRLLSRKEAALQQREAALKVVEQTSKPEEISALRIEAEAAREEATTALDQLQEVGLEVKSLRNMTRRMILTEEEMEEIVLKRCWLARYWSLCVQHGIHLEIARAKYDYWSSFAPLPVEVVLAAGQRAREEDSFTNNDSQEREKVVREAKELSGEGTVESMLFVEKGLRDLASLRVEDAVAFAMAQKRRLNSGKSEEVKLPSEGQFEAFELSEEESEQVRFKQAWLTYFWRRAKNHGVEPDIAEERLEFWINHTDRSSSSHDAVDVERGLLELRKLGIENQLWQASRKGLDTDSNSKDHLESDF